MSILYLEFELYVAKMNKNGSIAPDKEPRQQVDVPQQLLLFTALHILSLLGKIGQILPGLSLRVDKIEPCRHLNRKMWDQWFNAQEHDHIYKTSILLIRITIPSLHEKFVIKKPLCHPVT